jgi:hypothetical protein
MTERREDREETFYICGQCKLEVHHLKSELPPNPCPECSYVNDSGTTVPGWSHETKRQDDVPALVKIRLADYGG